MRLRLLLAFVVLWVPSLAGTTAHRRVYEEDVHFFLTYVLMRLACFTHEEALQIASADQGLDDNFSTSAGLLSSNNTNWHALGTREEIDKRLKELWERACKSKSLIDFGQYLHYQEDSHSHLDENGKPYGSGIGHALDGHQPDRVPNHPDRAREMAKEKLEKARKFMEDCLGQAPAAMVGDDIIGALVDALTLAYSISATGGYSAANLDTTREALQRILDKLFAEGKIVKKITVPTIEQKLAYDFDKAGHVKNQREIDEKLKASTLQSYIDPKTVKTIRTTAPPYAFEGDTVLIGTVVELEKPLEGSDTARAANEWVKDWWNPGDEKILTSTVVSPDAKALAIHSSLYLKRDGWAPIVWMVGSRLFTGPREGGATCTFPHASRPPTIPTIAPEAASVSGTSYIVGDIKPTDSIVFVKESETITTSMAASSSCSAAFTVPSRLPPGPCKYGIKHADGTISLAGSPTEVYRATYAIRPPLTLVGRPVTISADLDREPTAGCVFVLHNLSSVLKLAGGDVQTSPATARHTEIKGTAVAVGQVSVSIMLTDRADAARTDGQTEVLRAINPRNAAKRLLGPWSRRNLPQPPWTRKPS